MDKQFVKGAVYVALGASSYGVLATFVKMGGKDGFSTGELTFAQALVGFVVLLALQLIQRNKKNATSSHLTTGKDRLKLILAGLSVGLTSTFYYISLRYIPVSVCIVLLMQSVWIGSVIDFLVTKRKPTARKYLAIAFVLIGTVFTTKILFDHASLDWRGIVWGLLAGLSYSITLYASNNVVNKKHFITRSYYMMVGAILVVSLFWGWDLLHCFNPTVLWTWGLVIAIFGTIIPPILFTKGMPVVGIGLGSIIASVELPISVIFAMCVLGEEVSPIQWGGILLIIFAIVLMNLKQKNKADL